MKKLLAFTLSMSLTFTPAISYAQASGGANFAKMILSMSNGIVGASVLAKCKLGATQPSVMIYSAGGIAYVISEFAVGKAKTGATEEIAKDVDKLQAESKSGGDVQLKMIDAQIKDEKENLKFIKKRQTFTTVVASIYTAAMAMAIIETIWSKVPAFSKPDGAACTPNGAHKAVVKSVQLGYSALVSVSGQQDKSFGGIAKSVAIGVGSNLAMEKVGKILGIGADATDKASIPLISSGIGRIAFFGGSGALSFWVASDLGKQKRASEDRITLMEKSKQEFENATKDNNGIETGGPGAVEIGGPKANAAVNPNIATLPSVTPPTRTCLASGNSFEYSAAACSSPMKITTPNLNTQMYPPELIRFSNSTHDLANALASGDMARADIEVGKLEAQAGKIEALKDKLLADLNKKLKAEGKSPITIDNNAEISRQMKAFENELKQNGMGSGFSNLAGNENPSEIEEKVADEKNVLEGEAAEVVKAEPAGEAPVDFNLGDGESSEFENTGRLASLSDRLEEFEATEGDVVTDPGVSIFKQVSNRYLLNYEKVLNRKGLPSPSEKNE